MEAASGKSERLTLFTEWIRYEHRVQDGFVVFASGRGCYVQFALGPDQPGALVEIGTKQLEEIFGAPLPNSQQKRLSEAGFQSPDSDHGPNYWQEFENFDERLLANHTELAFKEIIREDENFTAKVEGFQ